VNQTTDARQDECMNQTTNTEGYKKGCWDPHTTGLSGSTWILTTRSAVALPVRRVNVCLMQHRHRSSAPCDHRKPPNAAAILRVQSTGRERTATQQRGAHAVVWGAWKWLRPVTRTKAALHLCCSESERPDQGSTAEGPNNNAGIPPQPHSRMCAGTKPQTHARMSV
jgi:hypothetical protein